MQIVLSEVRASHNHCARAVSYTRNTLFCGLTLNHNCLLSVCS